MLWYQLRGNRGSIRSCLFIRNIGSVAPSVEPSFLTELRTRGLVEKVINEKALDTKPSEDRKFVAYAGFDPTGPSLHLGHLLLLTTMRQLRSHGHRPIALIGGFTGKIGDPSGRVQERPELADEHVMENSDGIRKLLERFFPPEDILDNSNWYESMGIKELFRVVGRNMTIGPMLRRETVKRRLDNEDMMSFSEFSYPLFQAYDFLRLNEIYGCSVQLGGSDQQGNILLGIDYVKKMTGRSVSGITIPLLTTSDGKKFGKSAGNAIFLDENLTSPYRLYQFLKNTNDSDVNKLLRSLTLLPTSYLDELEEARESQPTVSQCVLAKEVVRDVFGDDALAIALKYTEAVFGGGIDKLSRSEILDAFSEYPVLEVSRREYLTEPLSVLLAPAFGGSRGKVKQLAKGGGLMIMSRGTVARAEKFQLEETDLILNEFTVAKQGKRNFFLLKLLD